MFYRDQRVICVNDSFKQGDLNGARPNLVVRSRIYTVRDVVKFVWADGADWSLLLHEVVNPKSGWRGSGICEIPFFCGRFRPLTERTTDISIFTAMLKPVKEDA